MIITDAKLDSALKRHGNSNNRNSEKLFHNKDDWDIVKKMLILKRLIQKNKNQSFFLESIHRTIASSINNIYKIPICGESPPGLFTSDPKPHEPYNNRGN